MALPYLRGNLINERITYVTNLADQVPHVQIQRFVAYLRRTWVPLANKLSVFGVAIRTNNICENFHKKAYRKFHAHPAIYRYLGNSIYFLLMNNRRKAINVMI